MDREIALHVNIGTGAESSHLNAEKCEHGTCLSPNIVFTNVHTFTNRGVFDCFIVNRKVLKLFREDRIRAWFDECLPHLICHQKGITLLDCGAVKFFKICVYPGQEIL